MRKDENQRILRNMAQKQNRPFDDLVRERTDEEILALKRKWGTSGDLLEAEQRIEAIAADIVDHYIENILPNGFKAQVVCSSKMAAIHYKTYIDKAIKERLAAENERGVYRDDDLCRQIAFLQSVVVVSSEGTNERAVITQARKHAQAVDAVENFKRRFDIEDPEKVNTGIAFLIVCDMLLTGFDAPIEQVMYIDKNVKNHDLLQTIARVNRVAKGKSRGYIVDYIGLTDHLQDALSVYAADDQKDLEGSLENIYSEIPVLEARYRRLVNLFTGLGVAEIEGFAQQTITNPEHTYNVLEQAVEAMADLKQRANFEVYLKKFMQSMDIILPNAAANPYKIPVKRFGYVLVKVKDRYKDDSLSISDAGEKVRKLIDEHLISLGINPKIKPVELMSPKFIQEVEKNKSSKAKASEMEHAIRKHCKVHLEEDPVQFSKLSEKLEALIQQYKDNWELLYKHLVALRGEAETGRADEIEGVSRKAAPFYDLIGHVAFGDGGVPAGCSGKVKQLVGNVLEKLHGTIGIVNFWSRADEVSGLKGELSDLMLLSGVPEIEDQSERIVTEITALAKVRHKDILE
jgi:type I restriction enzyme R subunit